MTGKLLTREKYEKGTEVIFYVVYESTTLSGNDEVLQHKIMGTETAHITLHANGTVNFTAEKSKIALTAAVKDGLKGFTPSASQKVKQFISKVRGKI